MKEQIPPIENNDEDVLGQEETNKESTGLESVVETKETKEDLVAEKKTEIEKIIEEVNAKKPTGAEPLNEKHVSIPEGFTHPKENFFSTKWKKIATLLGFAGAMAIPQTSEGKSAEDTLSRGQEKERVIKAKTPSIEKKNTVSFSEGKKETLAIRAVTPQERNEWNDFLSFVEQKGYKGSKELDKGSDKLARSLFAEYKTLHPQTTLDYSIVASVQKDMESLRENAQAFAKRRNDPNAENLMKNISKVDGWFGSQTSQYGYPQMVLTTYHNDTLVGSENLGVVDKNMNPEKKIAPQTKQKIPKGAKVERLKDGDYYENEDGDLVKIQ